MSEFHICKQSLWCEAVDTADTLRYRLENLMRSEDRLTPGERKAVGAMKRELVNFMRYAKAASGDYRMNAG